MFFSETKKNNKNNLLTVTEKTFANVNEDYLELYRNLYNSCNRNIRQI